MARLGIHMGSHVGIDIGFPMMMGVHLDTYVGLSEDLGPHDVFFSWVRWDGGDGISRMSVVVVVVVVIQSQGQGQNPP